MALEVREWGVTILLLGGATVVIYIAYNFAVNQGWISPIFRQRLTRMRSTYQRRLTHEAIYGKGTSLPARQ